MSRNIRNAEIKDSLFLTVNYSEFEDDTTSKIKKDSKAPIHDDLKLAFRRLIPHLALITQQVEEDKKKGMQVEAYAAKHDNAASLLALDPDNYFQFTEAGWDLVANCSCPRFDISGSGDSEAVSLSGHRTFVNNDYTISLSSPSHKYEDSHKYPYTSELSECIEACKHEVLAYLDGKHAPDVQGSLFGEEESEED